MSHDVPDPIQHAGESQSNDVRRRLAAAEPHSLRTYTPSLAVIARSAGSYHWTAEGRKLADFTSGVLVANLGHNPVRWWRRVVDYLGLGDLPRDGAYHEALPLTAYNATTEIELLASERLLANLQAQPGGARCQQVLWAASGSEAIQKALWAALSRDKSRDMILATRGGFHGKKGLAGAVTGSELDKDRDPRVRFISFPTEECGSVELRRQSLDLAKYENELDALWNEHGQRLTCLITEPYLGGGGSFHPQKEYLQLLDRFCKAHDLVFILDEVQANFGRTGPMYAFTHYGVEPDIVVLGKGLGNGVPVSAAVGRAELFAALNYGETSDTWSGNGLSSAAVLATLDEFESSDVLTHAAALAEVIEAGLVRLAETDVIERVRGEGLVWGIECAAVDQHTAGEVANACVEACYLGDLEGRAVHLLGPLAGKVIRVSPPLTMPLAEAEEYLAVMYNIFATLPRRLAQQPATA
ncbi:MAG: aspartate aminotransferase family protein [Planctomycetales bacterium]|nr:aspartate aminotransferase family protein [Planctomycetales bacterium]